MNSIMNENQLTIVKEQKFDKPLIQKFDSLFDNWDRDCHKKYFHTFEYKCEYDIKLTNITNNEIINKIISDKSIAMFELNKKLTIARERGSRFNQINKLTINIYTNLSNINVQYYLKLQITMCHRKILLKMSQNPEIIQTFCNDRRNPFHYACRRWYLYNYPQCDMV